LRIISFGFPFESNYNDEAGHLIVCLILSWGSG